MAKITALSVLGLMVALGRSGCGGPTRPTPSPSPTASPSPRGIPNATALDNLALIERLERAQGRQTTLLVSVSGPLNLDGRVRPGNSLSYTFGEIVDSRPSLFQWNVRPDGTVEYIGPVPDVSRTDYRELRPLRIDSPEMVRLGLEYGGQRFLDRYPTSNNFVGMVYHYLGGQPICQTTFLAQPDVGCPAVIYIHAHTGALMARDLSCLDKSSRLITESSR